jgi:hypothetical protein
MISTILITVLLLTLTTRVCRADGGGPTGRPPGRLALAKDRFQKCLTGKYLEPALLFFGIAPEVAKGSRLLVTELYNSNLSMMLPDRVVLLGNASVLDIEFQSSLRFPDLFRFFIYFAMLAQKFSIEEREIVPVSFLCVFPAGIAGRPEIVYPSGNRPGEVAGLFMPRSILLEDLVDLSKVVCDYWNRIRDWNPEREGFPLTDLERLKLYYAPLGRTPMFPEKKTDAYLRMGRVLSEKAGDPEIFAMMFCAVLARGDIANPGMIKKYSEVYRNMDPGIYEITEIMTGLNVPQLLDQLESQKDQLESQKDQLESQKVQLEYKDGQLEYKDGQLEYKDGQIESQKVLIESLSVNSVRALRGANFTAEEISERLKLDLSEVNRILKANGGGA